MNLKAKTIKALDGVIAALEELKDSMEAETTKSGDSADDEDTGEVSGRNKKAKSGAISGSGKKPRAVPDDDADVDGDDDADADGDAEEEADDELPPSKPAVKGKAAAKKALPKDKGRSRPAKTEYNLATVKEKLTEVMNTASLGKERVLKILGKYDAAKSAELDEAHYPAVIVACDKALAEVGDDV